MSWLLLSLALAPELPVRPAPIDGECPSAIPLIAGQTAPEDLIEPSEWTVSCGAVALPTSLAAYGLQMIDYGLAMDNIYRIEITEPEPLSWLQPVLIGAAAGLAIGVYIGKD